jgi:hypothetical protein
MLFQGIVLRCVTRREVGSGERDHIGSELGGVPSLAEIAPHHMREVGWRRISALSASQSASSMPPTSS